MRARFSAFRSREKQINPQMMEAREKYTPASKRKVKVSEDSSPNASGDDETQTKKQNTSNSDIDIVLDSPAITSHTTTTRSSRNSATSQKIAQNTSSPGAKKTISIPVNVEYETQPPTIRVSESILKIINDENESKKKKIPS